MADTKTVSLRPTETIEGGKELQRVNMSARQLNKVARMLAEAPGAAFVGHVDGLTIEVRREAPTKAAEAPTAPAKRKYVRKAKPAPAPAPKGTNGKGSR